MKRFKRFEVTFKKIYKYGAERSFKEETVDFPVEEITVSVWAEDVNNAIARGWQAVTANPQDYEILNVNAEQHGWRSVKLDE